MYLEFYKLSEYPFSIGCAERFFYQSSVHTEALANMLYTFQQRKGMALISGEVGAGKTFVGNVLASRLGTGCQSVILRHPPQSGKQLIRAFATGIGIRLKGDMDKLEIMKQLTQHLLRMYDRGRLVAMIVDEAQDLNKGALQEIRLLWNMEEDGQRLIQILLIGQPELRDKLLEPKWEPLRQRIVLSYHLGRLSAADTSAYIYHRISVAGNGSGPSKINFTPNALKQIYSATDGIPRLINILCDNALLVGYAKTTHRIDSSVVREVLRDMTCWGLRTPSEQLQKTLDTV